MNFAAFGYCSCRVNAIFFLYLNIHELRTGPGKLFIGVLEGPGKVLDFFVSKRLGTL